MPTILCLSLLTFLVSAVSQPAEAQQAAKIPRIGYVAPLSPNDESARIAAFKQGLRELGYIEGKNIFVEYRYAQGAADRIPALVGELFELKVDALVAEGFEAARVAKQTSKTIPVVMVLGVDPIETGLVESLARPGGNITGLTRLRGDLSGKRLEILKEVLPKMSRVGVLWGGADSGPSAISFGEYESAARSLKIKLQSLELRGPNPDLDGTFQAALKEGTQALVAIINPLIRRHTKRIVDLAIKSRLSAMYEARSFVESGGLMSYSAKDADQFKRAAYYIDKILKGAKPADLPVEQPTKFEFIVNLKAAKQIGLTIPPNVLARADKVIR